VSIDDIDPGFGNWLAGFIDGEGSFLILPRGRGGYAINFSLRLRSDERAILEECMEVTGLGNLTLYPRPVRHPGQNPLLRWLICTKSDCRKLVEILDRFPLRAKKARDFAIWRQAVHLHAAIGPGGPPTGLRAAWEPIARLHDELKATRVYRP
jgi:hypothetical protein